MPLSRSRMSMRNWLLPAPSEWSGTITDRAAGSKYGARPVA